MATRRRGENYNYWPRTVMTGGCLLVAFAPDGATGNDVMMMMMMMMMMILFKLIISYNKVKNSGYCIYLEVHDPFQVFDHLITMAL